MCGKANFSASVNRSKNWVKNYDPYSIEPGFQNGDEIEAKLLGNNHYYISFTGGADGRRTILEIR